MKTQPKEQTSAEEVSSMTQAIDLLSKIHAELQMMNKSHANEDKSEKKEDSVSANSKPGAGDDKAQPSKGAKKCAECFSDPCKCEEK
jgi:hypothetical protein